MITVVVPALNEEKYLPRCLDSLKAQDFRGGHEIVVVDNGSEDATTSVAMDFGATVISEPRRGAGRARQAGFMAARGSIVASTDADTILPADWLSSIRQLFDKYPAAVAVAGHHVLDQAPPFVATWMKASLLVEPFQARFLPGLWGFCGSNFAVRTDAFWAVGGFRADLEYDEDTDLCRRLRRVGPVVFSRHLVVTTSGRAFTQDHMALTRLLRYKPRPQVAPNGGSPQHTRS